jgi:hypothetical protein
VLSDQQLKSLIEADDLGLLKVAPLRAPRSNEDQLLEAQFEEIAQFVLKHQRMPNKEAKEPSERQLGIRLHAIELNSEQMSRLKAFDSLGILQSSQVPEPQEISDDDFWHLVAAQPNGPSDIFELKHVKPQVQKDLPDYVAQRTPCKDFHLFETEFIDCQRDLKLGQRKMLPFAKEQQIEEGQFFVLNGVLCVVAEVKEKIKKKHSKVDARIRCIFENGTESGMLLRSLGRQLYKDGKRVTELDSKLLESMGQKPEDKPTGYIYVLRSLSENADIKSIPNLFKIGLATKSIESRIEGAKHEPTYLLAPVKLLRNFECFNLNLSTLEQLLHRFFAEAQRRIQVRDLRGQFHTPKEWFTVPIETIDEAVDLLLNGEISKFRYDMKRARIVSLEK